METNVPEKKNLRFSKITRERLYFIYDAAEIQETDEDFFRIKGKIITREGIINITQGVVST